MSEDSTTEADRLRYALEMMRDAARKAATDHPGCIVFYDPVALAALIDAVIHDRDTTADEEAAAQSRADRVYEVIQSGSYRLVQVAPSVHRVVRGS